MGLMLFTKMEAEKKIGKKVKVLKDFLVPEGTSGKIVQYAQFAQGYALEISWDQSNYNNNWIDKNVLNEYLSEED